MIGGNSNNNNNDNNELNARSSANKDIGGVPSMQSSYLRK